MTPSEYRHILLIGACGSGKTWVIKQVLAANPFKQVKIQLIAAAVTPDLIVPGVYDGSMFEGSDRLSMAVSKDYEVLFLLARAQKKRILVEGDRFTNAVFIQRFNPLIIKIANDGSSGRALRGSSQTPRHIKSIQTRVNNIPADYVVTDSEACLALLKKLLAFS